MSIVLSIHSLVRWIVVILALITAIKFLVGWLRQNQFTKLDRQLLLAFSISVDIQVVLGLILLIGGVFAGEGFPRYRLEHAFMMILALVMAHLPARWKEASDNIRFRNSFFSILAAIVFIFLGVMVLPGGWSR